MGNKPRLADATRLLVAGLVLSSAYVSAQSSGIQFHHRVFVPSGPSNAYSTRGDLTVDTDNRLTFVHSASFSNEILSIAEKAIQVPDALYQVALVRPADRSEEDWVFTSIPACHLAGATSETISLQVSPANEVFGFTYHVYPVPRDGACPQVRTARQSNARMNTTVTMSSSSPAPPPQLRVPPALSAEGKPITPVPEKSFIQKYWMYLVPFLIMILIASPEEEAEGKGGSAGGRRK